MQKVTLPLLQEQSTYKGIVNLHPNLGSGQTIWGAWEKKVVCQKRKRLRDLHKVFSGIILESLLSDQFVEHGLFENWTMENPSDSSVIQFLV